MDTMLDVRPRASALANYVLNEFRHLRRKYGLTAMIAVPLGGAGFLAFAWMMALSFFALL